MTETYNFSSGLKKAAAIFFGAGLLAVILGAVLAGGHGIDRIWSNLLICTYYFTGIGLASIFLIAAHQIGYGGWHVLIKRIPEAMGSIVPVMGIFLLIILVGTLFHGHHLYFWASEGIYDPNSPNYDAIIAETQGKSVYLNPVFYAIRIVAYVALWTAAIYAMRNISKKEDILGVSATYQKSKYIAAIFILIFAVTSSTGAWDIIMSVDPHWYSTLFGWYNFASYMVGALAAMILIVAYLKSQGYLKQVNEEHYHNLAMFMFGFSVFYTYLWFSQFLLIWYGNMPEETAYFYLRFDNGLYKFLFFASLFINFFFPFLVLMRRKSKRNTELLVFVAIVLFLGHWLDIYNMVTPGTMTDHHTHESHAGFGLIEFGMLSTFIGMFIFVVFNTLTKQSLIPVNNPYLKESITHHTLK